MEFSASKTAKFTYFILPPFIQLSDVCALGPSSHNQTLLLRLGMVRWGGGLLSLTYLFCLISGQRVNTLKLMKMRPRRPTILMESQRGKIRDASQAIALQDADNFQTLPEVPGHSVWSDVGPIDFSEQFGRHLRDLVTAYWRGGGWVQHWQSCLSRRPISLLLGSENHRCGRVGLSDVLNSDKNESSRLCMELEFFGGGVSGSGVLGWTWRLQCHHGFATGGGNGTEVGRSN